MFGNNLKATILGYEAFFKAAGFDFSANADKPDALKAFIEGRETAARSAAAAEAGTNLLKAAGLTAVEGKTADTIVKDALAARDSQVAAFTDGLKSAGVTPKPAKEGEALTATDIKTAVEARASQKAAATVAATGHAPIEQSAAVTGEDIPETADELRAQLATTAATDSAKRGRIAAKLKALREKPASGKN